MNKFEVTIEKVHKAKVSTREALTMINICLRGGQASEKQLFQDDMEWCREHGQPTWDTLRAWVKTLDFECGLVMPFMERLLKKDDGKNIGQHAESVK